MTERETRFGRLHAFGRRWHLLDVLLVLGLAVAGACIGSAYYAAASSVEPKPAFYQDTFGPAVMQACGRGFVNPDLAGAPALARFLRQQRTVLDCAEIPKTVPVGPLLPFQRASRYLMLVVAIYWRATAVSWDHLAPLAGALQGVVVGVSYCAFRVLLPRILAVPLSVALAFSRIQLGNLPNFRDSTKTAFFVSIVLVVLLVWTRPLTRRTIAMLSAAFGLVAAVAIGFRPDVAVWFPALGIALLFAQRETPSRRIVNTAFGSGVAVVTFVLAGWPILSHYESAGNFGHVTLLGLTTPFDDNLGVRRVPYTLGRHYDDGYILAVVNSYAKRVHGRKSLLETSTADYERYALMCVWEVARTFPADTATRTAASMARVVNLPFKHGPAQNDGIITRVPGLRAGVRLRDRIFGPIDGGGFVIVFIAFTLLAARRAALAAGFAATVLLLAGIPALQFSGRHVSHLEIVGLFALGLVIREIAGLIRRAAKWRPREPEGWRPAGRAVARAAVCAAALIVIPLAAIGLLRSHQQRALSRLFDAYGAEAVHLAYSTQAAGAGHVLVMPAGVAMQSGMRRAQPEAQSDYLLVDLNDACDPVSLTMRIRYASDGSSPNFTHDVPVVLWPRERGSRRLFVPVYQFMDIAGQGFRFDGLEFDTRDLSCITALKRVPDTGAARLWLDLDLGPNWKEQPLYQRLLEERDAQEVSAPKSAFYLGSPGLRLRGSAVTTASSAVVAKFEITSHVARIDREAGFIVNGVAESHAWYFATSAPKEVAAGSQLIAVGELFEGGFALGIQKDGRWSQTVTVTIPGRFVAAVEVPEDGVYMGVIANDSEGQARFSIRGLAWVPPPSGVDPDADRGKPESSRRVSRKRNKIRTPGEPGLFGASAGWPIGVALFKRDLG